MDLPLFCNGAGFPTHPPTGFWLPTRLLFLTQLVYLTKSRKVIAFPMSCGRNQVKFHLLSHVHMLLPVTFLSLTHPSAELSALPLGDTVTKLI